MSRVQTYQPVDEYDVLVYPGFLRRQVGWLTLSPPWKTTAGITGHSQRDAALARTQQRVCLLAYSDARACTHIRRVL